MKKLSLYIAISLSLLLISCGGEEKPTGPSAAQQGPKPFPAILVPTQTVTSYSTFPTSIEGVVNSAVRAKISGYITEVLVDEGQKVRKGQILFKLETQTLNQDAAAAKANVNAAQVEVDKLRPLVEKEIISNVQLETAKARLQQAQSAYNSIAANIGYGNIKSPVDGYVGSIRLRKGALVSPSDQESLTTVADISKVYAYFSMNEEDYLNFIQEVKGDDITAKIKNLPPVRLILANDTKYGREGIIETINSQINEKTGSVSFRAVFENPSQVLTNGSSGKIQVPKTFENALVVPKISTYEQQGSTYVYKIAPDSTATAVRITIEGELEGLFIVSEGIKKGDLIIGTGLDKLKGETKVIPQETAFDSIAKPIPQIFR